MSDTCNDHKPLRDLLEQGEPIHRIVQLKNGDLRASDVKYIIELREQAAKFNAMAVAYKAILGEIDMNVSFNWKAIAGEPILTRGAGFYTTPAVD